MPRRSATTASIPNLKHGLSTLKRAARELGGRTLDGRTRVGRALAEWKAHLIDDLGGTNAISTQQAAIIALAVKTKLLLDSVDAWLLRQPTLINPRRRSLLPVVRERQTLADALARYMTSLGLERRRAPIKSLDAYVAEKYQTGGEAGPNDASTH